MAFLNCFAGVGPENDRGQMTLRSVSSNDGGQLTIASDDFSSPAKSFTDTLEITKEQSNYQ
jgi:hypothetical protein